MLKNLLQYRHTAVNAALGFVFLGVITARLIIERLGDR